MDADSDTPDREAGSGPAQRVMLSEGEWNGLTDLLRGFANGNAEEVCAQVEMTPEELAQNYADHIDNNRTEWP